MCGMIENYDEVINLLNGIITTHLVPRSTVNFFISWKIVNRKVLKQSFHFYCSFDTFYPVFFFFFCFYRLPTEINAGLWFRSKNSLLLWTMGNDKNIGIEQCCCVGYWYESSKKKKKEGEKKRSYFFFIFFILLLLLACFKGQTKMLFCQFFFYS